jgi:hypothetical protein
MANDLLAAIRAKQEQIAKLQAELDEAKSLLLQRPSAAPPAVFIKRPGRKPRRVKTALVPDHQVDLPRDSVAYWAAEAIRLAGQPLHAHDIVKAIEESGHKVKLATLVGSLSRWVKRKVVFYRAGKNIFGLEDMQEGHLPTTRRK